MPTACVSRKARSATARCGRTRCGWTTRPTSIYVPAAPADYAGGPLALHYEGGQALALGNDVPPADIAAAGPSGSGIAAHCLP